MHVLIADKLSSEVVTALQALGCRVSVDAGLKDQALSEALDRLDPDVLVVRSTKVTAAQLDAARSLSLVIRAGAGVNTIDLDRASARGVYVSNCPGKNAIAVAELAIGHLVNLDRRIADNVIALRAGQWQKKEFGKARGLAGRTLAILGCGAIGREVARRARAFGMVVRGWDRSMDICTAAELGVTPCASALEACRDADAVTIHLSLNPGTRGLVDAELLAALRPGAYVINTSRGEVIDQDALERAIAERGLRAGLDVFADEPAVDGEFPHAIAHNPGVYGTHHIGASTDQASEAIADEVVRIVRIYLQTGSVENCVNVALRTPATHLLVVRHRDQVGVLASVLDLISKAGINVQEMENVIFSGAAAAVARIQLDQAPPPALRTTLDEHPAVFATSLVALDA
ncbi:3-phosphoglycerate dehydrogenase family protein [Myxococcota bacterium]|nr:3-phosphoglycerate dehydrogenase family protein [Myxococcota bacterium]